MPKAKRAILRLALVGWLGLSGLVGLQANLAQAAAPPEQVLPDSTIFFVKIADAVKFREAFRQSQYGQLWNDPALGPLRADLSEKLKSTSDALKDKVGVTLLELLELPQGAIAIAAVAQDDPVVPVSVAIIADAGKNADKMTEVLNRSNKQAEQNGAKVSTETFQNFPLHVIQSPEPKEKGDDDKPAVPPPPVVWTNVGGVFYIGSSVNGVKDLVSHAEGRGSQSLGSGEAYIKTQAKIGADSAHAVWFIDLAKLVKIVTKAGSKGAEAQAQQIEFLVQELGLNGLKSAGGSLTLNTGNYTSLTKTFFLAPAPVQGLLKLFSFPPVALKPEPWVPATVASYQSFSWDLDNAFNAINDLVNKFQPGMLNVLEQQLVGPEGGEPLSFQKDLFGPLGDRITMISDFKKPIKEDSQRVVVAISLEDAKAFQNTLNRVIDIAHAAPKKRDFQGTTILDFELPNLPNQGGVQPQIKGPVSVAVAKDTVYLTTDATLLEQVLRPGVVPLAESSAFQTVSKEFPEKISGLTFVRPDEQARLSYDMLKSGQFEKAIQQAMAASRQGRDVPEIPKLIDPAKLPDFDVFAKYLTLGGSYSVMDEDGFTQTGFSLRKANP
ncbi:MAG: hypothetical protein P4L85_14995 [Paludisphaera borealis]|uniref:hypothetical protein n=1 Tax=Paludisphaera borealis TaxID=1387353 RepID=UPI002844018D|nr:hypothetical protein [Paludisphaera borealis]MDR3620657.1 hypothetical protein [Paludisphaera borealis]